MDDHTGWIKLHRKLLVNSMYQNLNSEQKEVLFVCLMKANHKEKEWEWKNKIYICKPGQFITSMARLESVCSKSLTRQKIRTALAKLKKWKFLTIESTNTSSLVTICNWDTYQKKEKEINQPFNQRPTNDQPTINQQLTTNKNDKEEKNDKEYKEINKKEALEAPCLTVSLFDNFEHMENEDLKKSFDDFYFEFKNKGYENTKETLIKTISKSCKSAAIDEICKAATWYWKIHKLDMIKNIPAGIAKLKCDTVPEYRRHIESMKIDPQLESDIKEFSWWFDYYAGSRPNDDIKKDFHSHYELSHEKDQLISFMDDIKIKVLSYSDNLTKSDIKTLKSFKQFIDDKKEAEKPTETHALPISSNNG